MRGDAEVLGDRGRPGTTRAAASVRAASTRGGPWQAEGSGDGGVAPRGASFWDAVRAEALDARGMHSVLDLIADEARRAGAEARAVGAGARREPAWEPPASEAWGRAPEGLGGAGHAGRDVERDRLMPLVSVGRAEQRATCRMCDMAPSAGFYFIPSVHPIATASSSPCVLAPGRPSRRRCQQRGRGGRDSAAGAHAEEGGEEDAGHGQGEGV